MGARAELILKEVGEIDNGLVDLLETELSPPQRGIQEDKNPYSARGLVNITKQRDIRSQKNRLPILSPQVSGPGMTRQF